MDPGLVFHQYKTPGETRLIPMIAQGIDLMVNPGEFLFISLVHGVVQQH